MATILTPHFMSTSSRPRLSRSAKRKIEYSQDDAWFPDVVSKDEVHVRIRALNLESYHSALFALADDLICRALFGSKTQHKRWNAGVPDSSSHSDSLESTTVKGDVIQASKLCSFLTNSTVEGSLDTAVSNVCENLVKIPSFRNDDVAWLSILKQ